MRNAKVSEEVAQGLFAERETQMTIGGYAMGATSSSMCTGKNISLDKSLKPTPEFRLYAL
jgi:hypothetical protein